MTSLLYNNWGIGSLGIAFSLNHAGEMSLTNAFLVMPIISHDSLLRYLARKTTSVVSIEQLVVYNSIWFSNFNARYYDGMVNSVNAIQYMLEAKMCKIDNNKICKIAHLEFDEKMGKRAELIEKASLNISKIVSADSLSLYSNLRIEL